MDGIKALFNSYTGAFPEKMVEIPCAVSARRYFRIHHEGGSIIGTYSPDKKETIAFTTYARQFRALGVKVPRILKVSDDKHYYLQEDLGSNRMHEIITCKKEQRLDFREKKLYIEVISQLVKIQVVGSEGLDFSVAVPRPEFDQRSILWDMNYFKYYFLKPLDIPFDEDNLENCFSNLSAYIARLSKHFMFRDFQTRNILIHNNSPYFIDFQGGRRGPLQYDLASILLESKTDLSEADQKALMDLYLEKISIFWELEREQFMVDYYLVALVRLLQVLGAYGLRGLVEKKAVFLQSIPKGLANLRKILSLVKKDIAGEYLVEVLEQVVDTADRFQDLPDEFNGLTIRVVSFSYHKSLPDDITGNGGGFVYDCRFLKNPGLLDAYKDQSGLDHDVISYLKSESETDVFADSIIHQLESVIRSYQQKGYTNLLLSFGCTGGRHRSVYMAHRIADWCREKEGIRVLEHHQELNLNF